MQKIYPLSDDVISKIAAGEVIERPAYAVKELVENAVDAKANVITVHIEDSGLKKIVVIDNGEGMSSEDVKECFKPHTTSKLATEDQLHAVSTLGFRGEALASIASICDMTIKSKTAEDIAGTQIKLHTGNILAITSIGMSVGTSVTIDNLFYPVPARKKFLKSKQTEFRHILEIVSNLALAHPEIRFVLTHNSRTIFDLPKVQTITERIHRFLGSTVTEQLISLTYTDQYVGFTGYIAKPQMVTHTSSKQMLFVNNRRITDKQLTQAVKEGYGNLLEATASPIYILFLALPPEIVDVNVHPRKEQVRFLNKEILFQTLKSVIDQTLKKNNLTFLNLDWKRRNAQTKSYAGQLLKQHVLSDAAMLTTREANAEIQQIHNLYLLTQTQQGLLIIDQHAAHERILYEKFLKAFSKEKTKAEIVTLKEPLSIVLSITEQTAFQEYGEQITKLGFHFTESPNKIILLTVPKLFQDWDYQKLISEMLEDILEEKPIATVGEQSNKMLAYLACRSAVKAGDPLTKLQIKDLLTQLEKTQNNATCPHGRPTRVAVNLLHLHKLFKRL